MDSGHRAQSARQPTLIEDVMENTVKTGMNRTGMQMAPLQGPTQVKFAAQQGPAPGGPEAALAERVAYTREAGRVGSVPIPGTGKGLVTTAASKITGNNPEVLIDKLGQRLAYERRSEEHTSELQSRENLVCR